MINLKGHKMKKSISVSQNNSFSDYFLYETKYFNTILQIKFSEKEQKSLQPC